MAGWIGMGAGTHGGGKGRRFVALLCLWAVLLAGCGATKVPETVDAPSVAIGKEGEVRVWQVGIFDRSDYKLSELRDMAVKEAGEFNSSVRKKAAVTVEKVEALEDGSGKVVVEYRFDSAESCSLFLEEELFFGTVADAGLKGRGKGVVLKSVKDGTPLPEEELRKASDRRLIVTGIKANLYCPGRVTHISEGASVNGDGSIDASGAEGLVYILLK